MVAAAESDRPFPIAVFCNPVNIGPEFARWIATALARHGIVTATFSWMSSVQGFDVMVPGVQTGPGTVAAIVAGIERLNGQAGPLKGRLDTSTVVVGGHSAGGSIALMAADLTTHPQVRAVFSMAGHNARPHGDTVKFEPLGNGGIPVFLIAGTNDGVIDRSRFRYGVAPGVEWDPMGRTFNESLTDLHRRHVFARLSGANHFSFADPDDDATVGRPFMDSPSSTPGPDVRRWCAAAIGAFCVSAIAPVSSIGAITPATVWGAAKSLDQLLSDPLVCESRHR